jgi:hypothetical protein
MKGRGELFRKVNLLIIKIGEGNDKGKVNSSKVITSK